MIRRVFLGVLVVTGLALVLLTWVVIDEAPSAVDQRQFFLEGYRTIAVGFLVAFLGIGIPHLLAEARDRFEHFKESRAAYSAAKTAVLYLPEALATRPLSQAVSEIRHAHEKLHLAETYPSELMNHLRWHAAPRTWVDRNYWEITAYRAVLRSKVDAWDGMTAQDRIFHLQQAFELVEKQFGGRYNEKWQTAYQWWQLPARRWKDKKKRESEIESRLKTEYPCSKLATVRPPNEIVEADELP